MRHPFLVFVMTAVAAAGLALWLKRDATEVEVADASYLANRVWAERAPRNERDLVTYFAPIEVGNKRVGLFERASRYAHQGQRFTWKRDGDKIVLDLLQEQESVKLGARTWSCKGEAPEGFDLCLELSDGKEKLRLYSRKAWRVPKATDVPVSFGDEALDALLALPSEACDDCVPAGIEAFTRR